MRGQMLLRSAYRNAAFMKAFAGQGTAVKLELNGRVTVEMKTLEVRNRGTDRSFT